MYARSYHTAIMNTMHSCLCHHSTSREVTDAGNNKHLRDEEAALGPRPVQLLLKWHSRDRRDVRAELIHLLPTWLTGSFLLKLHCRLVWAQVAAMDEGVPGGTSMYRLLVTALAQLGTCKVTTVSILVRIV